MAHYDPTVVTACQDASNLVQKVEIRIATRNLLRLDLLSESDPFVVVSLRDENTNKFFEIGRTEVVWDKRDADFETRIPIDYYFEKEQLLKFDVYDCDNAKSNKLSDHDFAGTMSITLGEIIHCKNGRYETDLLSKYGKRVKNKQNKEYQTIIVQAETAPEDRGHMVLKFRAINLPKMDSFLGKVDPYFRICRVENSELTNYKLSDYKQRGRLMQYKSEIIKREYNPNWKEFEISEGKLFYSRNSGKNSNQFEVQIYDWDLNQTDDFIGSVLITMKDLKKMSNKSTTTNKTKKKVKRFEIDLLSPKLAKKYSKLKQKPTLILEKVEYVANLYDFLYSGGCDFNLMVAVDYTSSNLQKDYKIDLHHINKNAERASPYQMAIRRIGNILQTYDSDKKYPLFGFGAWGRFKGNSSSSDPTTSHAFNVNTDMLYKLNEEVDGIDGLEKTYSESIAKLRENQIFRLSGPTYFSGILKDAKEMAQESWNNYVFNKGKLEYFIFLIITDGAVSSQDMLPTINQIVDIATKGLPLSIIIVGVGKGPFDSMNLLDGDFLEDIREIENDTKFSAKEKENRIFKLLQNEGYKYQYVDALKKIGDRDIVDFVELNQFDPITLRNKSGLTLESDTLEEIPLHFKRFVKIHSIVPPNHENFSNNKNNNNNNNYNVDNKEMELDHEYDEKQQQAYNQSNNNYYNGSRKRAPSHSVSGVPSAPNAPNGPTAPPQDAMGTHYGKGYNTVATGGGGAKNASQSESEEDEDEEEDDDNGKEQEKQVSGGSCQCCVLM